MSRSVLPGALLLAATLACTFSVPSVGSISGSGNVITIHENQTGFDRLEIGHSFDATITQDDEFSVVIRIDDNFEDDLHVTMQGDTLSIGLDPDRTYTIRDATLEVDIAMPVLEGLDLSGASRGTIVADDNSIYRAMRRFEGMGVVGSSWQDSDTGPRRRYYELTPLGRELLARFIRRNVDLFREPDVAKRIAAASAPEDQRTQRGEE